MKRIAINLILFILFITYSHVYAELLNKDPIPKKDFIAITEEALNKLDVLEVLIENYRPSFLKDREVDEAFTQLEITLKKYRRYLEKDDKEKFKNTIQGEIIVSFYEAKAYLFIAKINRKDLSYEEMYEKIKEITKKEIDGTKRIDEDSNRERDSLKKAKEHTQMVRELFMQYK